MVKRITFYLLILIIFSIIAGCAAKPRQPAYHITDISQDVIAVVTNDAVTQMSVLFAPEKTKLVLTHPATDQFGLAFVDRLREKGFTVKEHPTQNLDQVLLDHREHEKHTHEDGTDLIKLEEPDSAVPLSYLLDHGGENYHAKLTVGNLQLMRIYSMQGGEVRPSGHWIRQEPK
ncbi:hypothetical protein W03_05450 [Nitrosomonas sp. PY1]|uniref:hypothetical protein n=1 Tax=Nitrosomonas sp. PY1 TaxID=1803906 RepID=UPI001FC8DF5A|nr:hypothetical protein [Nitrosomonas sp. PY1]GKS68541.1 hypothetical protein W03_05450 [Nitrosomonas sp. PY1]